MKLIIGIATTEERYEFARKVAINLRSQCMKLFPMNEDGSSPFAIHLHVNSEDEDKADNGKFIALNFTHRKGILPDYFLSCDDDIIYPKNYVRDILKAIDEHKCIVTYHGRKLTGLDKRYYSNHVYFPCTELMDDTVKIDVAGTGVTGFATNYFNPWLLSDEPELRMVDLLFSLQAAKENKTIKCLKHSKNMFKLLPVPKELTIYEMEKNNNDRLMKVANEIYTLNN